MEAVINDQWCDAKVARVIPPTQQEIDKDNEDDDDEVQLILSLLKNRQFIATIEYLCIAYW